MNYYYRRKVDICFIFLFTLLFFILENKVNKDFESSLEDFLGDKHQKNINFYSLREKKVDYIETNLKLKNKDWYKYSPKINIINPNDNIFAIIIPNSGLYNCGKIIDKVFSKINWNNYKTVILLSISYKNKKNWELPSSLSNVSLNYNKYGELKVFKSKDGKLLISSFNENKDHKLTNLDKSTIQTLNKGIEVFNKENSWQAVLPFLISLNKKIKLIPLIIGKYDIKLENQLTEYLNKNPKTLLIANNDLMHCGLDYSEKCPLGNTKKEFDYSTIKNIKLSLNNLKVENKIKQNIMTSNKGIYLFSKICNRLGYKSDKYYYFSSSKYSKRPISYFSMVMVKNVS
ncbi:MAG: AmmeMemoRadiSam system protein B [Bacteroidetes bacterium]|nr:AmmeMemoRadiSam system protein B [Bacteroidota bacterium]